MNPPKPRSALQRVARVFQLGVALGVVTSFVATLLTFELASLLRAWRWEPTFGAWLVQRLLLEQLGPLVVAPLVSYLAGRVFVGQPRAIGAATVVTLQLAAALQRATFAGFGGLAHVEDVLLLVLPTLG